MQLTLFLKGEEYLIPLGLVAGRTKLPGGYKFTKNDTKIYIYIKESQVKTEKRLVVMHFVK